MEEDSTTAVEDKADASPSPDEDFDIKSEPDTSTTGKEDSEKTATDSGDDTKKGDDNAPSDADDKSGDDDKSKTDDASKSKDAPAFDKDLDQWAEKKGYGKPETDRERKALQVARDSQREYSRSRQTKAAEKTVKDAVREAAKPENQGEDEDDPMLGRLDSVETRLEISENQRAASDFMAAQAAAGTPVSDAEGEAMANLLKEYAENDGKAGVRFLTSNVARWHRLAKMELADTNGDESDAKAEEAAKKAREEERENLARKSASSGPTQSAKSTTTAKEKDELTKIWEDDSI